MASGRPPLVKALSLPTLPTNFVEGVSLFAADASSPKSVCSALADRAEQLGGDFPTIFHDFALRRAVAQADDDAALKQQKEERLRRVTITPPPGVVSPGPAPKKPRLSRAVSPPGPAPKKQRTCRITIVDTPGLRLSRTVSLDSLSP